MPPLGLISRLSCLYSYLCWCVLDRTGRIHRRGGMSRNWYGTSIPCDWVSAGGVSVVRMNRVGSGTVRIPCACAPGNWVRVCTASAPLRVQGPIVPLKALRSVLIRGSDYRRKPGVLRFWRAVLATDYSRGNARVCCTCCMSESGPKRY